MRRGELEACERLLGGSMAHSEEGVRKLANNYLITF